MSEKTWYACACGAEHDTPTCPFRYSQPTPDQPPVSARDIARKALTCLYIAVEPDIAADVQLKVEAAFTEQATLIEQQAARIAELAEVRDVLQLAARAEANRADAAEARCKVLEYELETWTAKWEPAKHSLGAAWKERAEAAEARCTEQAARIVALEQERDAVIKEQRIEFDSHSETDRQYREMREAAEADAAHLRELRDNDSKMYNGLAEKCDEQAEEIARLKQERDHARSETGRHYGARL